MAEHSMMPQFASERPDEEDKNELISFTEKIKAKLDSNTLNDDIDVPGKKTYVKSPNLPIKIKTNKDCVKCGICAKSCPVKAISFENPSCTDKKKCITCMRCVSICPKKARSLPPVLLSIVGTVGKSQFKGRKENTLYL